MKRIRYAALTLALTGLLLAPVALAHGGHGKGDRFRGGKGFGERGPKELAPVMHALRALDLSDDQRAQIKGKLADSAPQIQENHQQIRDLRKQLHEGLASGTLDAGSVQTTAEQIGDLVAENVATAMSLAADVRTVLTDEQIAELDEMRSQRMERRERRRERVQKRLGAAYERVFGSEETGTFDG